MATKIPDEEALNYEQFRDCISAVLIQHLARPPSTPGPTKSTRRSKAKKQPATPIPDSVTDAANDAEDLSDFIDFIATEIFSTLPEPLRILDHHTWTTTPSLQETYSLPLTAESVSPLLTTLDPSITDSLLAYGIINETPTTSLLSPSSTSPPIAINDILGPVVTSYLNTITTPPPPPASTRSQVSACEICGRDWINLSYHHLIPRFVHAKVVKRGWHRADELQNVAWLCGACHRFVHQFADHENLARRYYTVDLLMEQPEIQAWADWVGRLRWKGTGTARRGP